MQTQTAASTRRKVRSERPQTATLVAGSEAGHSGHAGKLEAPILSILPEKFWLLGFYFLDLRKGQFGSLSISWTTIMPFSKIFRN